jgi:signal transduction histidine kinase/ActR/RegA family two-component response regulator
MIRLSACRFWIESHSIVFRMHVLRTVLIVCLLMLIFGQVGSFFASYERRKVEQDLLDFKFILLDVVSVSQSVRGSEKELISTGREVYSRTALEKLQAREVMLKKISKISTDGINVRPLESLWRLHGEHQVALSALSRVIATAKVGKQQEINQLELVIMTLSTDFLAHAHQLFDAADEAYKRMVGNAAAAEQARMVVAFFSIALVMVILLFLNVLVMRGVVQPLMRLALLIRSMDKENDTPVPYTNNQSEIGDIARALEDLRGALGQLDEYDKQTSVQGRELLEKAGIEASEKFAVEANDKKSKFLATMAHELRTPISSLMLLSEELIENPYENLNEKQLRSLSFVMKSGKELMMIVNDILDLAKVESGELDIVHEEINIREFSQSLKYRYESMATSKGLGYGVEVASGVSDVMTSDELRLEQVIRNFISNAMKFTESGKVNVVISVPSTKDIELHNVQVNEGESILIAVHDTGMGIPPSKLGEVFDEFKQVGSRARNSQAGTGLGLSISRKLAKMLGGGIFAASVEGKGSCFSLCIPLHLGEPVSKHGMRRRGRPQEVQQKPAVPQIITKDDLAGRRVLVVDDDERNMFALTRLLKRHDINSDSAYNGQVAVEALEQNPTMYDIVLLDIMMPVMDGYEVLSYMQGSEALRKIPVIVITAKAFELDMEECLDLGASDYLSKPIISSKLFDSMISVLNNGKK